MNGKPRVERAKKAEVGLVFASSKIKYTWVVRVEPLSFEFVFMDSKKSKKKRFKLNERMITEQVSDDPNWKVRIIIQGSEYMVFKEGSEYRLKINGIVDRTPFQIEQNSKLNGSNATDCSLSISNAQDGSYHVVVNSLNYGNGSAQNNDRESIGTPSSGGSTPWDDFRRGQSEKGLGNKAEFPQPVRQQSQQGIGVRNGSNTPTAPKLEPAYSSTAPFDQLNDSYDLYSHAQYFMLIKEPVEDQRLIKAIHKL